MAAKNKPKKENKTMEKKTKVQTTQKQQLDVMVKMIWAVCAYSVFLAAAVLMSPQGIMKKQIEQKAEESRISIRSTETDQGTVVYANTDLSEAIPVEEIDAFTPRAELNDGYIIQFNDHPEAVRKLELEREGKAAEEVNNALNQYRADLISKQEDFKSEAATILNKDIAPLEKHSYTNLYNGIALNITKTEADKLKSLANVKEVYPNHIVTANLMDSTPLINVDDVWDLGYTGEGVKIAVVDTGVDYTHPDLGGCTTEEFLAGDCEKVVGGYDVIHGDDDPIDDHGHGTHVAGTAAGEDNSGLGVSGVAPDATIYAYKVLSSAGKGSLAGVMSGVERAATDGVDVISMSLGARCGGHYSIYCGPDDPLSTTIDNIVNSGIIASISAGNSGPASASVGSPGAARKAITVGASYKKDYEAFIFECTPGEDVCRKTCSSEGQVLCDYWGDAEPPEVTTPNQVTSFSSRGPVIGDGFGLIKPDIIGPGAVICAARYDNLFPFGERAYYHPCGDSDGEHVQLAGTSMSAPHISGVSALLLEAHPEWNPDEVKMAIRNTATDLYDLFSYDRNTQGYGEVDALLAVESDTPPIAYLHTSGDVHGLEIPILGIASAENLVDYSLHYAEGYTDDTSSPVWNLICSGTENVIDNNEVCSWNVSDVLDGEFTFKLQVNSPSTESIDYALIKLANTEIFSPSDLGDADVLMNPGGLIPTWQELPIIGTSIAPNYSHFTVEWSEYNQDDWSTEGITLSEESDNGQNPVLDDELATFNVANHISEADFYNIKLTTHRTTGEQVSHIIEVRIDPALHEGWPKSIHDIESPGNDLFLLPSVGRQPTLADMDDNGTKELVFASGDTIAVLDHTGELLPGWPVVYETDCEDDLFTNAPIVSDLDNNGLSEIVAFSKCSKSIYVLENDGTERFNKEFVAFKVNTPVAVADLNNDQQQEIIVLAYQPYVAKLYVIDSTTGGNLDGWPRSASEDNHGEGAPFIAHIDENRNKDIIMYGEDRLVAYNYESDNIEGFPLVFGSAAFLNNPEAFFIADIDNDQSNEIVLWHETVDEGRVIAAYNTDGTQVNGFPQGSGILFGTTGLSAGDIDMDNKLEIISTEYIENCDQGYCNCINVRYGDNGETIPNFPVCETGFSDGQFMHGFEHIPTVANFDEDMYKEIIAPMDHASPHHGLVRNTAVDHDGSIAAGFPKYIDFLPTKLIPVDDIDNDGDNELIIISVFGSVYIWDMPGSAEYNDWTTFKHDSQFSGYYHNSEQYVSPARDYQLNNSSFEIDTGRDYFADDLWGADVTPANDFPDGWGFNNDCVSPACDIALDYFNLDHGQKSIKIEIDNRSSSWVYQDIPVTHRRTYRVEGYVKTECESDNCSGTLRTECRKADHSPLYGCGLEADPGVITGDTDWTLYNFEMEADHPDAEYLRVLCHNSAAQNEATGTIWCDNLRVRQLSGPKPPSDPIPQDADEDFPDDLPID